jgi:hypothetical protein
MFKHENIWFINEISHVFYQNMSIIFNKTVENIEKSKKVKFSDSLKKDLLKSFKRIEDKMIEEIETFFTQKIFKKIEKQFLLESEKFYLSECKGKTKSSIDEN